MKIANSILFLVLTSVQMATASTQCQKDFGQNVAACAQTVNNQSLAPKDRADAHKACVDSSKAAKVACENGQNQCFNNCQSAFLAGQNQCSIDFDTAQCAGDATCEATVLILKENCLAALQNVNISCLAGCQ